MKMCLGTLPKAGKIVEMKGGGSEPWPKATRFFLPLDKYFRGVEFLAEIPITSGVLPVHKPSFLHGTHTGNPRNSKQERGFLERSSVGKEKQVG